MNNIDVIIKNLSNEFNLIPYIGVELEFFLLPRIKQCKKNTKEIIEIITNNVPKNFDFKIIEERGKGQFEIIFEPTSKILPYTDYVNKLRSFISSFAKKNDHIAYFASKPFLDDYGSSMQINISFDNKSDINTIEKISNILCNFIKPSLNVFLPKKNDYKRLDHKFLAPTHICYGNNNRTVAIRIIEYNKKYRLEHRLPAANADSYQVIFTILNSIYLGLTSNMNELKEFNKIYGNAYDPQYNLERIMP